MMKCPNCGSSLSALTKFCEACGVEIPAKASPIGQSTTVKPAVKSASELSVEINQDLAALGNRQPSSTAAAFCIGLITVPTLGLGYLAAKGNQVFGSASKSPARAKLALDQNLRIAETECKSDPGMRVLIEKGRAELSNYKRREHAAGVSFFLGIGVSAFVCLILLASILFFVNQRTKSRLERAVEFTRQEAEAVRLATEKRMAENHADFLSRNLAGTSIAKTPGVSRIAVLVADEKQIDQAATQALVRMLQSTNSTTTGGLFTEAFVADGNFSKVFNSDGALIKQLELATRVDEILLVKKAVRFTKNSSLDVISAALTLSCRLLATESGAVLDSFTLSGAGAGLNDESAEALALERTTEQFKHHQLK